VPNFVPRGTKFGTGCFKGAWPKRRKHEKETGGLGKGEIEDVGKKG
jgi:hypothetical protein